MSSVKLFLQAQRKHEHSSNNVSRTLRAYLTSDTRGSPQLLINQRRELAWKVEQEPESPDVWWDFLSQEESCSQSNGDGHKTGRNSVSLFHLFALATQTVPRQGNYGNAAYLHIWIGFAENQW